MLYVWYAPFCRIWFIPHRWKDEWRVIQQSLQISTHGSIHPSIHHPWIHPYVLCVICVISVISDPCLIDGRMNGGLDPHIASIHPWMHSFRRSFTHTSIDPSIHPSSGSKDPAIHPQGFLWMALDPRIHVSIHSSTRIAKDCLGSNDPWIHPFNRKDCKLFIRYV